MAARPAAQAEVPTLTDADVEGLRARLAAGETPRVVVRAASAAVPAGTRGSVVRLGDPALDEYVVVRIGRDEVPFGPAELSLPGAKPVARAAQPPAPATLPALTKPGRAPTRRTAATPKARRAPAETPSPRRAPAKLSAPLTVTLRFAGGQWTAEASRGARRLAKPAPIKPGAVGALAEHLADDALRDALVETVEASRAEVEQRAAALRAELSAAEASLRDYETKPRRAQPSRRP
jgi:hypothetical protein